MKRHVLAIVVLAGLSAAHAAPDDSMRKAIEESRIVASQVSRELRNQLVKEMQISGPLRSMVVCKFTCPEILSRPSRKTGWRISAVSLKPRNPATGTPDEWEQRVLIDFDRRAAKGEPADALEFSEVVTQPMGRFLRYAKSMPVEPMCLRCHGSPIAIPDAVKAQLNADYPFDKAVDFTAGQVYGIVSIKRPF